MTDAWASLEGTESSWAGAGATEATVARAIQTLVRSINMAPVRQPSDVKATFCVWPG